MKQVTKLQKSLAFYQIKPMKPKRKGESDENKNGYIELDEVLKYFQKRVIDPARRHGLDQTPVISAEYSGKIGISKDPARLTEVSREAEERRKKEELDSKR